MKILLFRDYRMVCLYNKDGIHQIIIEDIDQDRVLGHLNNVFYKKEDNYPEEILRKRH